MVSAAIEMFIWSNFFHYKNTAAFFEQKIEIRKITCNFPIVFDKRMEINVPKVVRLRRKGGEVVQGCDQYIGRTMSMSGWKLKESLFANPFKVKEHGDRAIPLYRVYLKKKIAEDPDTWVMAIIDLEGKTLGCWCKPAPCHGDVLMEFYVRLKEIFTMDSVEEGYKAFLEFLRSP